MTDLNLLNCTSLTRLPASLESADILLQGYMHIGIFSFYPLSHSHTYTRAPEQPHVHVVCYHCQARIQGGGVGGARPPFHRQNITFIYNFLDKICTRLQENASKISKVPRGHAFRPPPPQWRTPAMSALRVYHPHPPPFQNPGSAPDCGPVITKPNLHFPSVLMATSQLSQVQRLYFPHHTDELLASSGPGSAVCGLLITGVS